MVERTVDIAATLDDVWAVLVDVERWPEWAASMVAVTRLDAGPFRLGSRVRVRQPRVPPARWAVTGFDPKRSFTWTATAPGLTTAADHELAPTGNGRVRVTLRLRRSGPMAALVDVLSRRLTERYVALEAEGLKRRCETGTFGPGDGGNAGT